MQARPLSACRSAGPNLGTPRYHCRSSRTVVAVAQEIIRRYRRVLIELSAVHIDTLIHIARNSTQLRPFVLGILSELVARPCAHAAAISADVEHPDGTFLTLTHCFEGATHEARFQNCICELRGFFLVL